MKIIDFKLINILIKKKKVQRLKNNKAWVVCNQREKVRVSQDQPFHIRERLLNGLLLAQLLSLILLLNKPRKVNNKEKNYFN